MIVVCPSTWQKTSWFFELSRLPFSMTVIGRTAGFDLVGDDVHVRRLRRSPGSACSCPGR